MNRSKKLAIQAAILIGLALVWQIVVSTGLVDANTLPAPTTVLTRTIELLGDKKVLYHLWITTAAVLLAAVVVAPIGVALGLLLGESDYWGRAFKSFFFFMSSVPKSVFLPLFILSMGIGFTEKVAFGVFQAIFVLVISAVAAAESVPDDYLKMAKSLGATRKQMYRQIYLPAMLPLILEGLRLGMIFNITGVLFAEMYASRDGLGHLVSTWGMSYDMPSLFAGITLAALLAIVVNESLRWYENKLGKWRV